MEIQFLGFVYEVFDEVAGQIARTRFRSGGTKPAPVTIRTPLVASTLQDAVSINHLV